MKTKKCKALDDITYKDRRYQCGVKLDVDIKDIEKLEKIGAIQCLEPVPKVDVLKSEVKIGIIKNPIKTESKVEVKEESEVKPKRKYTRRNSDFSRRRY